jgi:aubergine-like protein
MNKNLTRYYSRHTRQHTQMELADGLKICMTAALKEWTTINGAPPDRVIIYRDGVGDGQLHAVLEHEVVQVKHAFGQFSVNYNPKWAYIIVKKRINHRFFLQGGSSLSNPAPGTVVDSAVTKPEWYDFFLVSQVVAMIRQTVSG